MKYIVLCFLVVSVYAAVFPAVINRVEVIPANGKTRIKIYLDNPDIKYYDVVDKSTNKLIVKVLNTTIASPYSKSFSQADITTLRAARNNPQDVWVVAELSVPMLTKEHSVQREGNVSVIVYDVYFPVRTISDPVQTKVTQSDKNTNISPQTPQTTPKTTTVVPNPTTTSSHTPEIPAKDTTLRTMVDSELGMATVISIKSEDAVIVRIKTGGAEDVGIEDAILKRSIDAAEYEKACILLNEYARKYPEHAAYFYEKIGELYLKENDFTQAREFYRKAYDGYTEKSQDKSRAAYFIGQISFTLNQYQDAIKFTDYTVAHSTITQLLHKTYLLRGDVFQSREDSERALDSFNRALNTASSQSDTGTVLYKLYRVYRERKDYKAAHTHLTKLVASGVVFQPARKKELDFDNADLYYLLTEREKSIIAYKELLNTYATDPDSAWVFYQLGTIYRSMNNTKEALQYFTQLIEKHPTSYWAEHARFHVKSMTSTYNEKKQ